MLLKKFDLSFNVFAEDPDILFGLNGLFQKTEIVFDHFHVIQLMNTKVVEAMIFGLYSTEQIYY